jgi:recombination protein RecR
MVVARDSDFESIEKSGAYKGLYFILGGTVPVLDKEPEKRIRLKSLLERVSAANPGFREVIMSLNTTPDGEHTEEIVHEAMNRLRQGKADAFKITILGRGLSTGAELEYVDSETIKNALKNRN